MKTTICDVCKQPIDAIDEAEETVRRITFAIQPGRLEKMHQDIDLCVVCWNSPIILAEMRRTRTRIRKPKVGRPKGSRKTTAPTIDPKAIDGPGKEYTPS